MIGVFPALLNPEKHTNPNFVVGSQIGAEQFLAAMLRYLPGETIGMFVPEASMEKAGRDVTRLLQNEELGGNTVNICGMGSLPRLLQTTPLLALHDSSGPFMHRQAYLRAQFAARNFPITCLAHGLSYASAAWDFYARLLLTPTLPCDAVICTSRAAHDAFANLLERASQSLLESGKGVLLRRPRLEIVPLGVDVEVFRPRDRADARRLLGLPPGKTMLLYFGRISASAKGDLAPLLRVFSELTRKHGHKLILVLAGNYVEAEVGLLRGLAHQLGCHNEILFRPQPSIVEGPLYYAAADIFVSIVDTLQESFGITPLEAMASGLPAVVSDWSGYRDTVIHNQTGFRVKTYWTNCAAGTSLLAPLYNWEHNHLHLGQSVASDTLELFQYLDVLVANPQRREEMGCRAREHALAHFDWRCVMRQAYSLWQELSAVAQTLPHEKTLSITCTPPDYYADFSHYASQPLTGLETLQITEWGRQACRRPEDIRISSEMQGMLDSVALRTALRYVRAMSALKQQVSMENLAAMIAGKYKLSLDAASRYLMWLIKQGLLRVENKV